MPLSGRQPVRDVAEAVCLLTNTHGVNLYRSRGGTSPTTLTSDEGGPARHSLHCLSLFDRLAQCSMLNVQYFISFFLIFVTFFLKMILKLNSTKAQTMLTQNSAVDLQCSLLHKHSTIIFTLNGFYQIIFVTVMDK